MHILVKDDGGKEVKVKILCSHMFIFDHTVIHTRGSYDKMNYYLFFKLGYEEEFLFSNRANLRLIVDCKYCGKNFKIKAKRNDHA